MQSVTDLTAVRSAFSRSNQVIELAKLLAEHGYRVENPKTEGYFRYSIYAPQGWISAGYWIAFLDTDACDWECTGIGRNDGYLGDFVVYPDFVDWLLRDPLDAPGCQPNPCHCEALVKLAEILGVKDVRILLYGESND